MEFFLTRKGLQLSEGSSNLKGMPNLWDSPPIDHPSELDSEYQADVKVLLQKR